jgi:hypothetical protein
MNNFVFYDSNLKFDIFNINLDRIIKKEGKSIIKLLKSELIRSRGSKAKKKRPTTQHLWVRISYWK